MKEGRRREEEKRGERGGGMKMTTAGIGEGGIHSLRLEGS